jgi:hypothetical protein
MWISMGYQQVLLTKGMLTTSTGYQQLDADDKKLIAINHLA